MPTFVNRQTLIEADFLNRVDEFTTKHKDKTPVVVDFINNVDVTALGLIDQDIVIAKDRSSVLDNQGGVFKYEASSSEPADGIEVFAPSVGTGRLVSINWNSSGKGSDVSLMQAGGDNTGNTTNVTALATLTASTGKKILEKGVYLFNLAAGETARTTSVETSIEGSGPSSVLNHNATAAAGTSWLFKMGTPGLYLRKLKLLFSKSLAGVTNELGINQDDSDVVLDNLTIDGQNTLAGSTQNKSSQLVQAGSNTNKKDLILSNSKLDNMSYAYIRTNANTTAFSTIKVMYNRFTSFWRTILAFNAPNGTIDDVLVIGNTFKDHAGIINNDTSMGGVNNSVGLVGTRGARVIGNHNAGSGGALVHVEENTVGAVIALNTAYMANPTASDGAIETLANNVSGTMYSPEDMIILGNWLKSSNNVGAGIDLQNPNSADTMRYGNVSYNVSTDFAVAARINSQTRSVLVTNNVLRGSGTGFQFTRPSLLYANNVVVNTTTPITGSRGGLLGSVHYVNESTANAGMTAFGTAGAGPLILTEWTWESDLYSTISGTNNLDLGPVPTRFYGTLVVSINAGGSKYRAAVYEVTYDGTTFTNTLKQSFGTGTITITGFANNAGQLALQYSDSVITPSVRTQVKFCNGYFVI